MTRGAVWRWWVRRFGTDWCAYVSTDGDDFAPGTLRTFDNHSDAFTYAERRATGA